MSYLLLPYHCLPHSPDRAPEAKAIHRAIDTPSGTQSQPFQPLASSLLVSNMRSLCAGLQASSMLQGGTDSRPQQPDDTTSLQEEQDSASYSGGNHLQMFKPLLTPAAEGTNKPQAYPQRKGHPIPTGMSSSKEGESNCLLFPMGAGQEGPGNSKPFTFLTTLVLSTSLTSPVYYVPYHAVYRP